VDFHLAIICAVVRLPGRSPIMNAVLDHAARGGAVMGICNGFQILTETGMVPGSSDPQCRFKIQLPQCWVAAL
jgi:phosphoribosylformylglycinamidine (FGAM) synthase-like amidotransferase family enzyme